MSMLDVLFVLLFAAALVNAALDNTGSAMACAFVAGALLQAVLR